jgi:hypothetical protein
MRKQLLIMLGLFLLLSALPAFAERGGGHDSPRANQGVVPLPPERRLDPQAQPEVEYREGNRTNNTPHVERNRWCGHDAPGDPRYRIERPFERGRFERVGPAHRYGVVRFDRNLHRFWFVGGYFFDVAAWDWPICADWCWDCGDDFAMYEDADHIGWYLLYNVHTGAYVHVRYLGR